MKTVGAMFLLTVCVALATQSGCSQPGNSPTLITGHKADASSQWSEDLFSFAVENLNHLEDNDCAEMLQSTVRRIEAVQLDTALAQVRKLKDSPAKAAHRRVGAGKGLLGTAATQRPADQLAGAGHAPAGRQPLEPVGRHAAQDRRVEARPDAGNPACETPQVADAGRSGAASFHGVRWLHADGGGLAPRRRPLEVGRWQHD